MPSYLHEMLVELITDRPELAVELITDLFGITLPAHSAVAVEPGGVD